jgi:hypothetical protein
MTQHVRDLALGLFIFWNNFHMFCLFNHDGRTPADYLLINYQIREPKDYELVSKSWLVGAITGT